MALSPRVQSKLFTTWPALLPSKSMKRATWSRMATTHCCTLSGSFNDRSSARPDGSPINPVAPPTSARGRWPCNWRRRNINKVTRLPICKLDAVGSKPA